MKTFKINSLVSITLIVLVTIFTSCKKEDNGSRPTYLPDIAIKGEKIIIVYKGDNFPDPGAIATVNGAEVDFTVSPVLDIETPGATVINYTAINSDGFSASDSRIVVVVDTADGLNQDDLSGSFTRVGQAGSSVTWTKDLDLPYTYTANNPGGVPPSNSAYAGHNEAIYKVFNVASGIVSVPLQTTATLSPFSCVSTSGDLQIPFNKTASSGDVAFEWVVLGSNFGTSARTFRKI